MNLRAREGAAEGTGLVADASNTLADVSLADVPRGAFALAGAAVGLLLLSWLLVYALIFLPRGAVG
ncbi:MAG: hypothetical protein IT566_04565 [Rhodospirillaceae bacterium]|nr:hypothetical protein [Rhodospirillaceae bacterium]